MNIKQINQTLIDCKLFKKKNIGKSLMIEILFQKKRFFLSDHAVSYYIIDNLL